MELILILFQCVCEVFKKYRISFQMDKCEFLKKRVEYVGYDILRDGDIPAQSKVNLLNDCTLPSSGHPYFHLLVW